MRGVISEIRENKRGKFGFITKNDERYYFDGRDLVEGSMDDLAVGSLVEFMPRENATSSYGASSKGKPQAPKVHNVKKVNADYEAPQTARGGCETPKTSSSAGQVAQRQTGIISKYINRSGKQFGYIDGNIRFELANVVNAADYNIDVATKDYPVSFEIIPNPCKEGRFRAVNVEILGERAKRAPQPKSAPNSADAELISVRMEDIVNFNYVPGETLVIVQRNKEQLVGNFVSLDETNRNLCLKTESVGEVSISFSDIAELYFFGLITSFDILNSKGQINNKYAFLGANVISKQLAHYLRMGTRPPIPCLFSLIKDGGIDYIRAVDYFDGELCKQLRWRSGVIEGLYEKELFFSVEKNYRCYVNVTNDSSVNDYVDESDFLRQEVFYKYVVHKTADERRRGTLSNTVVDIRGKYQLGTIKRIANNEKRFQSAHWYESDADLSSYDDEEEVRAELLCCDLDDTKVVAVDRFPLPSHKDEIENEKEKFEEDIHEADISGDYEEKIRLYENLLKQESVNPEQAIGSVFQICAKNDCVERLESILNRYEYMLDAFSKCRFRMCLDCLCGKLESAAKLAEEYKRLRRTARSSQQKKASEKYVMAIMNREMTPEELKKHISNDQPFAGESLTGWLETFDNVTGSGSVQCRNTGRSYSCTAKDFCAGEFEEVDLESYHYWVSFEADVSKQKALAHNVKIIGNPVQKTAKAANIFDSDLNNVKSCAQYREILEFRRDNFPLEYFIGYLPPKERERFDENKRFKGTVEEAIQLIETLKKRKIRLASSEKAVEKPNSILAAACIFKQISDRDGMHDEYFTQKRADDILCRYACEYLALDKKIAPDEVEYYCEFFLCNPFEEEVHYAALARCLREFFAEETYSTGKQIIRVLNGQTLDVIGSILEKRCLDLSGLVKLLFNLCEKDVETVLHFASDELSQGIAKEIVRLSSNDMSSEEQEVVSNSIFWSYYNSYNSILDDIKEDLDDPMEDLPDVREHMESVIGRWDKASAFMFDSDKNHIKKLVGELDNDLKANLVTEDIDNKINQIPTLISKFIVLIADIENHPSKFSFEVLRPFLKKTIEILAGRFDTLCRDYMPKLSVDSVQPTGDRKRIRLALSNEQGSLAALSVWLDDVKAYGDDPGFIVDTNGTRAISNNWTTISGGKVAEFEVPIVITKNDIDCLELSFNIKYECDDHFAENSVERVDKCIEKTIQVQLESGLKLPDNKYANHAGGLPLNPRDNDDMFKGRTEDLDSIYQMIKNENGSLKRGCIVAIYGQKRCGKSSVMNFLAKKIRDDSNVHAFVIDSINAQDIPLGMHKETFFNGLMSAICTNFSSLVRKDKALKQELVENGLHVPNTRDVTSECGYAFFQEFFQGLKDVFPNRPLVVMVDEFTQAYVHMKKHLINEDFLNRWRAMVDNNGFVNVIVGQDFMDKFTSDEEITCQNLGSAVNGLGTTKRKRLTYLDRDSAEELIVDPIRFESGVSRYQGLLGQEAISKIYELTGGSAFYIMKFCNALVDYMIKNHEPLVTPSLVDMVARGTNDGAVYAFDKKEDPIRKDDFDPIFNEYSLSGGPNGIVSSRGLDDNELVQEETRRTYRILKLIADNTKSDVCNIANIKCDDIGLEERNRILKSLMARGVLVDGRGRDIYADDINKLDVKIKVGLFTIWLQKRG